MNRRSLLGGAALAATTGLVIRQSKASYIPRRRPRLSHVAVLRCDRYERTPQAVEHGLQLVAPSVKGKRVLLKPNLVEYSPAAPINTHPVLIAAVVDAFYKLGASVRSRRRRSWPYSGHGSPSPRKRSWSAA